MDEKTVHSQDSWYVNNLPNRYLTYLVSGTSRVDWVTMDEEEEDGEGYNSMGLSGSSEAPF